MSSVNDALEHFPIENGKNKLGVIMDPELSWNSYVTHITNRCFGIIIALMHIKHINSTHMLPEIVNYLRAISRIRYCEPTLPAYVSANRTHVSKLTYVYLGQIRIRIHFFHKITL